MLLRSASLAKVPGVAHGFTTRGGGVSRGPLATLNLAYRLHEDMDALCENWRRVVDALGIGAGTDAVAVISQVHGADVVVAEMGGGPFGPLADADAMVTRAVGVVLAVRVADCVPVLLATPNGVGVAHAGWRGLAGGVVGAAVQKLVELTGDPVESVVAAIGPHISGPCFEVGPEVVEAFAEVGLDPRRFVVRTGWADRMYVDLGIAVEDQLRAMGVVQIDRIERCTFRDPELFSHRRDGPHTGRQAGVIARCSS